MEKPEAWYEEQLTLFLAVIPLLMCQLWAIALFWAKLSFERVFFSSSLILMSGCGIYLMCVTVYHLIWTTLGLSFPCPFAYYTSGSIAVLIGSTVIWFRYFFFYIFTLLIAKTEIKL